MKKYVKRVRSTLWQLWKDTLAASAAIVTGIAGIATLLALFSGEELELGSIFLPTQFSVWLPLIIFTPAATAYLSVLVFQWRTIGWTEARRHKLGWYLVGATVIMGIAWIFAKQSFCLPKTALIICGLIPFVLGPPVIQCSTKANLS